MAAPKDWIIPFMARHTARFLRHDWPVRDGTEAGDMEYREFVKGWNAAFRTRGVSEAEADSASVALAANPPRYRDDHLPAVLALIQTARMEAPDGAVAAATYPAACEASRHCEYCSGSGMAVVYRREADADAPATLTAHCVCPAGRFLRARVAAPALPNGRYIPDMEAVLAGVTLWTWDAPPPCGVSGLPTNPKELLAYIRRTPPVKAVTK